MAVRTLLLKKLSGSTLASVVTTNAPAVLRTTRHVAAVPSQVGGGSTLVSGLSLLFASTAAASQEQLIGGLLLDAVEV